MTPRISHRSHCQIVTMTLAAVLSLAGCLDPREDDDPDVGNADATPVSVDATPDAHSTPPDATPDAVPESDASIPDAAPVPLLGVGEACVASAECESSWCTLPCSGYGVCAPATCEADADCEQSDGTVCCVEGRCESVPGGQCGDHAGTQGASCVSGGGSDCAAGYMCLGACMSTAYCSFPCQDDGTCHALGDEYACYRAFDGVRRCVRDPDMEGACASRHDCQGQSACVPTLSYDGANVIKVCTAPMGAREYGTRCGDRTQCQSGTCESYYCTEGCGTDDDCACQPGEACTARQICLDTWYDLGGGQIDATKMCAAETRCTSDEQCPDEACTLYAERAGWSLICQRPGIRAKAVGETCRRATDCRSEACFDGECRAVCAVDADCGEGPTTCQATPLPTPSGEPADAMLCR